MPPSPAALYSVNVKRNEDQDKKKEGYKTPVASVILGNHWAKWPEMILGFVNRVLN